MKIYALVLALVVGVAPALAWDLYSNNGTYLGNTNSNPYDPNSINNPYGQYGNPYYVNSINNKYGQYGNQYSINSPNNPYSQPGTAVNSYGNARQFGGWGR